MRVGKPAPAFISLNNTRKTLVVYPVPFAWEVSRLVMPPHLVCRQRFNLTGELLQEFATLSSGYFLPVHAKGAALSVAPSRFEGATIGTGGAVGRGYGDGACFDVLGFECEVDHCFTY